MCEQKKAADKQESALRGKDHYKRHVKAIQAILPESALTLAIQENPPRYKVKDYYTGGFSRLHYTNS